MNKFETVLAELKKKGTPERARAAQRYFKTGKGEYGEGDVFVGVAVPDIRKISIEFADIPTPDIEKLLKSEIHEARLTGFLILVRNFEKSGEKTKKKIFDCYLKNIRRANNWDLVDLSAPKIVSKYLLDKPRDILYKLARSKNLWEKRVAIMGTCEFIRRDEFDDTFKIAEILLEDKQDLIQKAVGWMLREAGKRSLFAEEAFLKKNIRRMGRTMLRYAIEKFPESKRKAYLSF